MSAPAVTTEYDRNLVEKSSATFSRDRAYRYVLTRVWDGRPPAVFVMLNPSSADAFRADPTVTRCLAFARREQRGGLVIVNLFALRATDPRELRRHPHPVGVGNDLFIRKHCETGGLVVAAWGAYGPLHGRDRAVLAILRDAGIVVHCLGLTADGAPRHPLYLRRETRLAALGD